MARFRKREPRAPRTSGARDRGSHMTRKRSWRLSRAELKETRGQMIDRVVADIEELARRQEKTVKRVLAEQKAARTASRAQRKGSAR